MSSLTDRFCRQITIPSTRSLQRSTFDVVLITNALSQTAKPKSFALMRVYHEGVVK